MPDGQWKRAGNAEMMESLDSARQYDPKEQLVACDADHSQISKLKRGESGIYKSVRWAIKHAVLRAAEEQATEELSRFHISMDYVDGSLKILDTLYGDIQQSKSEGKIKEAEAAYVRFLKASTRHALATWKPPQSGSLAHSSHSDDLPDDATASPPQIKFAPERDILQHLL